MSLTVNTEGALHNVLNYETKKKSFTLASMEAPQNLEGLLISTHGISWNWSSNVTTASKTSSNALSTTPSVTASLFPSQQTPSALNLDLSRADDIACESPVSGATRAEPLGHLRGAPGG